MALILLQGPMQGVWAIGWVVLWSLQKLSFQTSQSNSCSSPYPKSKHIGPHRCPYMRVAKIFWRWLALLASPHVLWEVSFGFWVTWSTSSWQQIKRVFSFPNLVMSSKSSFSVSQAWGLNFLKTKFCQSSQIYLSPEKTEKTVYFLSLETFEW